ncbi:hypothetical protein A2U01_0090411, partial [Trifolium medium]|nr:hypothetical protein [Trifolium medium]
KNLEQRGTRGAIVPDGPPLRIEAGALRGPGHPGGEIRGVQALGETRMYLETPHVARKDMRDALRGDVPQEGVHQGETLHFLD